jgi:hypothetical protein
VFNFLRKKLKLTKSIIATLAAAALALTGLVATSAPAMAADNVGVYPLNINNASAPGNAKEFITYNGKVYFTADSVDHGRAIFSTDATAPSGFQYFESRGIAPKMGNPRSLFGFNNNIFYWDSESNTGTYTLFGKSTSGTSRFRVETPDGDLVTDGGIITNFVSHNNQLYVVGASSATPTDYKLWTINANGDLSVASDILFEPRVTDSSSALGYGSSNPSVNILDGKLYVNSANSGWNTNDSKLWQYDIAIGEWAEIQDGGQAFLGSKVYGKYRYNGADVLIFSKPSGWDYLYYYLTADAVLHRLGNFMGNYSVTFTNLGERLFTYNYPVLSEVSAVDGSLTDMKSVLAPNAQNVHIESMIESNGKLVVMAKINDSNAIPANVEHLYQWDGSTALTQIGTVGPIPGTEWIPEWPSSTGWSRNTTMVAAGNGVILNLYADAAIGYEPYYVSLSGTSTALGNIDSASDGSAPNMNCSGSTPDSDYLISSVTGLFGEKSTLTQFKQDGIYLKYRVLDLAGVRNICAIASDGTNTFFKGYDPTTQSDSVFKLDANRVLTRVGAISESTYEAAAYNGNYFWLNDDNSNIYETSSAGVESQLTGMNGNLIREGSVRDLTKVGSKLYFVGQNANDDTYNLYSIDLANPTAAPIAYITNSGTNWKQRPTSLTVSGTKLYFAVVPVAATDGSKIFAIDTATNSTAVQQFDLLANDQVVDMVDYMEIIGNDFYISVYDDDNGNNKWLVKRSGTATVTTEIPLPNDFKVECLAPIGGDILLTDRNGNAKYLGDGSTTFRNAGITFSNDSWALCDAIQSPRGTFVSYDEVARQGGPFGSEPAYIGNLIPMAIERLGVAVTENPASALEGTVQPFVPGPNSTVDTDDVNLSTLDETKDFKGSYGSISFPDGSGFSIDSKGYVRAKTKSIYLVQASGKIKFSYLSGGKTKSVTCNIKTFGSKTKSKKAFTTKKVYTSATACRLSTTVVKAMKTGVVTIVQTLKVYRYYSTTMKAKTPGGSVIKAQNRKMTVRMGKIS